MTARVARTLQPPEAWWRGEMRTMAFVDILGFADEVKRLARRKAGLPKIVEALLGGPSVAQRNKEANGLLGILASQEEDDFAIDLQAVFFSDSAFVSARDVPGGADRVLKVVLGFARHLLLHGFFVRGGIARGLAAHSEGIAVGPAVLAAYHLENKTAIFPRIVVEDVVARELLDLGKKPNATVTIRRGEDGLYFVDVLTTLGLRSDGGRILRQARKLIVSRLEKRYSSDVNAKWRWLAAQYNRAVRLVGPRVKGTLAPIDRSEIAELPEPD